MYSEIITSSCNSDTIRHEYAKLSENKNVVSTINLEQTMQNTDYRKYEMPQSGVNVILVFPHQSKQDEVIKKDVKMILSDILEKYIEKTSM